MQPVRPVRPTGQTGLHEHTHAATGQTGPSNQSDRSFPDQKLDFMSRLN